MRARFLFMSNTPWKLIWHAPNWKGKSSEPSRHCWVQKVSCPKSSGGSKLLPTTLLKINMSLQKRDHSKDKVLFQASIFSFVGCITSCLTETSHIPRKSQVSAIQEQTTPTIIPLVDSVASVSNVLCDDCTLVFFVVFFWSWKVMERVDVMNSRCAPYFIIIIIIIVIIIIIIIIIIYI